MMSDTPLSRALAVHGDRGDRTIIGVAGCPGSGKTTLVRSVIAQLEQHSPGITAWVPMDGFHLADTTLRTQGRLDAKGAIDTFDGHGYLALLRRVRTETETMVYAPEFDRTIEQPIAGGMAVPPTARIIFSEGNYLLSATGPWPQVRAEFDEVWFCDVPHELRIERLIARHVHYGKSRTDAEAWVAAVDEPNAVQILQSRTSADFFFFSTEPTSNVNETVVTT